MKFSVEGKEYTLEYTFEAAENQKCVDAMTDIFGGAMMTKIDETKSEALQIRDFLMTISDLPRMAMDMFYAGLLENHGEDGDGDGTITSRLDAKRLYKQFCKENPDDTMATSYYGLITVISNQMEEDGFFKRTGLADILESMGNGVQEVKKPTDRKKKQPTKKQKEAMEKKAETENPSISE